MVEIYTTVWDSGVKTYSPEVFMPGLNEIFAKTKVSIFLRIRSVFASMFYASR